MTHLIDGLSLGGSQLTVRCPHKTKELMDKWHSQRMYHLQKANPAWTPEQVGEEFVHDDERVGGILVRIVADIEEAIAKNRLERETEEKARELRLRNSRSQEKKEETASEASGRTKRRPGDNGGDPKKKAKLTTDNIPADILERQTRRVEAYNQSLKELDHQFDRIRRTWVDEQAGIAREAAKKARRFEDAMLKCVPSRRDILQQIELDLRGVQHTLSLAHLHTLGRSPFYDYNARSLIECAPRDVDEDGNPYSRAWVKKVMTERKKMRDQEQRDDEVDAALAKEEAQLEEAFRDRLQKYEAKKREIAERQTKGVPQPAISPIKEETQPPSGVEISQNEDDTIDWNDPGIQTQLKSWLLSKTAEIVGDTDNADLTDFILDLLPPRGPIPTKESLAESMVEFLEEETGAFVNELWCRVKSKR